MSCSREEGSPEVLINGEKLLSVDADSINQLVLSRPFDNSIFYTVFLMIVIIGSLFGFSAPVYMYFLAILGITIFHTTILYNQLKRNEKYYLMSNISVNGVPVRAKNANEVISNIC